MYTYVHIYEHMQRYTYIYKHTHTHVGTYIHTSTRIHLCICLCKYVELLYGIVCVCVCVIRHSLYNSKCSCMYRGITPALLQRTRTGWKRFRIVAVNMYTDSKLVKSSWNTCQMHVVFSIFQKSPMKETIFCKRDL